MKHVLTIILFLIFASPSYADLIFSQDLESSYNMGLKSNNMTFTLAGSNNAQSCGQIYFKISSGMLAGNSWAPMNSWQDSHKWGDGSLATEALNYAEVAPSSTPSTCASSPALCGSQQTCETEGWYWCLDACQGTPCGDSTVIYEDSFEYTNFDLTSNDGFYINTADPNYCVNPDPPNNCATSRLGCGQAMGPVIPVGSIPDSTCRHSLNIGTIDDNFPAPVDGQNVLRTYIDLNDTGSNYYLGGLAELNTNTSGHFSADRRDRWYGSAIYVPTMHAGFSYVFLRMSGHYVGSSGDGSQNLYLDGGQQDATSDAIRIESYYGNTDNNFISMPLTPAALAYDGGSRVNDTNGWIIRNNQAGNTRNPGTINDTGDWIYLVEKFNQDNRDIGLGNEGSYDLWYASQDMIDNCNEEGINCYVNIFHVDPMKGGLDTDNTSFFRMGLAKYSNNIRDTNHYPMIIYRDNFKVSTGALATDALNFDEVDPAPYEGEEALLLTESVRLQNL